MQSIRCARKRQKMTRGPTYAKHDEIELQDCQPPVCQKPYELTQEGV